MPPAPTSRTAPFQPASPPRARPAAPSTLPAAHSTAFALASQPDRLAARWQALLSAILPHPTLHARLLNTISLLEHIGCRKIVKALDSLRLDQTLLQHIAEEARHAFFFKQLAERTAPRTCPDYQPAHLLAGREAQDYIQGLDQDVDAHLQGAQAGFTDPMLSYLWVTTLIEERAGAMYGIYDRCLRAAGSPLSLRTILHEEERHLDDMYAQLGARGIAIDQVAPALRHIEAHHFARWLDALEAHCHASPSP
ncbi:MAG: hypothetical protein ACPGUV_04760 [Polyangiales bacterium]